MNEWEFTAQIASWINGYLSVNPEFPFSKAACEQAGKGSSKRRDLTLLDRSGRVVLTGEIKLPFRPDGGTPHNAKVVADSRSKALRAESPYFFTWNVNEFVLWETRGPRVSWRDENYRSWEITNVLQESQLESPPTEHALTNWVYKFLREFSGICRGTWTIESKPPDEKFIDALESALLMPVRQTQEELWKRYATPRFKAELDQWMREEQGWTITDDPEGIRENLENAAKAACYALVNKLVFHDALLKNYESQIERLDVPAHIGKGEDLRQCFEHYFAAAKDVTGDYETVFGENPVSIGNRIPFYSDLAVPYWRELIAQINRFDFSQLDYEVIGSIFERLVDPDRRRKYGQFFTRAEVVDLINSFCIRTGREKVMDPACGGGTFLVRAYSRKREILHERHHGEILGDLYGIDVADFPARLTTINLAVRDLVNKENYPRIARQDFFNVRPGHPFLTLPRKVAAQSLGAGEPRKIEVPELDAVIGNPPYIRQEEIRRAKRMPNGGIEPGTKESYRQLVREEAGLDLSGRSDIHCYFWPHAAAFLKKDGYLCFLTSSQWLDVEYGFRLQEWILRSFEIVAVFESIDEPWFVGARVATTITILRRQSDHARRMENTVRFVQIRRPIGEILAHDGTAAGAVSVVDGFRDEILALDTDTSNGRYRARLVKQGDLWDEGVRLGITMAKAKGG
ncbi:MAG: N-6 DNA methylase, partial [Candidatus Sumerlaeota bacterium]|nr:N-6 DNA methylase [Candidatus Sumerlaeota bacterium]